MKIKVLLLSSVLATTMFAGCAPKPATNTTPNTNVTTTASIVNNQAAFEKAISKDGKWIIAIVNDLKIDKDLVLEGEFKNGKKDTAGKDIIQRKVALYTQDANKNVTARFTLTSPKFTIKSPNASIQHGNYVGDLYVDALNFQLIDAKVVGNIYFTNDQAQATFKMDATSTVSGVRQLKK